ncbi:MAG: GNAT family N-acetyltransferase [Alphaproteobacteria bacterium]|nr:GNAT family N-acetyltransferase [Alphaproteobacteria bacterium]
MNIFISPTVDVEKYNHFIEEHPNSNLYHLLEWHEVLKDTYGLNPVYVIAEDANKIVGCIPLMEVKSILKGTRLVSLPLSYNVPILSNHNEISLALLNLLQTMQNKYEYIELRDSNPTHFKYNRVTNEHVSSQINLDRFKSHDDYWTQLKQRKRRRNIRKECADLTIRKSENKEDFKTLYELTSVSKKRQGAASYPKLLFINLHKKMSHLTDLYIAYHNSVPLAGVLIIKFKSTSIYAYGGALHNKISKKYRPMDVLLWEAIKNAFNQNQLVFDFGSSPKNHSTLIAFKEKWSPQHINLSYKIMSNNYKHISRTGLLAHCLTKSFKIMPLSLNKIIGPYLLKQAF